MHVHFLFFYDLPIFFLQFSFRSHKVTFSTLLLLPPLIFCFVFIFYIYSYIFSRLLQPLNFSLFSFFPSSVDLALAMSVLPKAVATFTQLWMAQKTEVATAATHALELLLKDAIAPACITADLVQQHHSKLLKCFNLLEQGLSYQYHNVWHQVLYTLKIMFEVSEF